MNKKKKVLITGAGHGLGRAIAIAFHNEGFEVIATDIEIKIFSDIEDKERFTCLKLDVTSEIEMRHCSAYLQEKFNQIDVLVSNAGIFDFYPVSEAGADHLKKIFDVNVFGLANLTKYFLPLLSKAKGRLIVIGSESYKVPSPFQPYAITKQTLESVYRAIKIELSLIGIKCILIRPGAMQTKILDDTIHFNKHLNNSQFEKEFNGFIETVPNYIYKIVNPEKVAKLVLKVATSKRTKSVYHINHNPIVSLLAILPNGIKNIIVKNGLSK